MQPFLEAEVMKPLVSTSMYGLVPLPVPVLRTLDFPLTSWPASRNLSIEHLAQQIVARGSMAAAILVLLRAPSGVLIWRSMGSGFIKS